MTDEIEKARTLLSNGKTYQALEYLLSKVEHDNVFYDRILGLLTRMKTLESHALEGILRDDEYRSQQIRIQKGLILLLREIENYSHNIEENTQIIDSKDVSKSYRPVYK